MHAKRVSFGRILEQRVQYIKMDGTSRRRNFATLRRQREFCILIIKSKKGVQNSGHQGTYELGHGNQSSNDIELEEEPVIYIFPHFG